MSERHVDDDIDVILTALYKVRRKLNGLKLYVQADAIAKVMNELGDVASLLPEEALRGR